MDRALPILAPISPAQTCVWMDAGMVAFRLCDRGFACEHCPFDAAMRRDPRAGDPDAGERPRSERVELLFPADRLYSDGHLWVQTIREGHVRAGIDAYAARLLHPVLHVRPRRMTGDSPRGEPWCVLQVEGGEVPLSLPVAGRVSTWNWVLDDAPSLLTTEPYASGWLAEMILADAGELDRLLSAKAAQGRALHDARQLRRNVAFRLLSGAGETEPGLDGAFLDHTQYLVGASAFVMLAREFLH